MTESQTLAECDVAVIGAGVVGCAIARKFSLLGARVCVLEKAAEVLDGASKANSAILHTGFDAPVNSLELRCIQKGYRAYEELHAQMNLPIDRCGALVLAWSEAQSAQLPALMAQARENAVRDVHIMSRTELLRAEPALSPSVVAGFRVPGESLIDPWSAPHGYLRQALLNGAELLRETEVLSGAFDGAFWQLNTNRGSLKARHVINAAGLYGDIVDQRLLARQSFDIRPRKGQFVLYDKTAARLTSHILLPVPSKTTKGIVVCRTIYGNLLVGPTAEEQSDRATANLDADTLADLHQKGCEILPALADEEVTTTYAGLRPACGDKEYQIRQHSENMITVGAIRSTGLSAALGIAEYVAEQMDADWTAPLAPLCPKLPILAEAGARDWAKEGHGGIICHCEMVTKREIETAMSGPLAPRSLAGLKRQTRAMMGRCQGFYCSGAIEELTGFCSQKDRRP